MSLDVVPEPPELPEIDPDDYDDADVAGDEYRRGDLERFLREGAWEQAYREWTATTEMNDREAAIARDLELFERFDFFWDDFAGRVGYHAPGLPEDWREREIHPGLDSWGTVSSINAGLTELGQTVCDVLADDYVDWEAEFDAPDDLPDF
jgi:hypothetical protein